MVYDVPAALFEAFPERALILRTADATLPARQLGPEVPERVQFLQVTDLRSDPAPLVDWGAGLPVDLVMTDPAAELPLLYRWTGLLDRHPTRVTIPLMPGLTHAVKLAVSLGFSVRLAGHQPAPGAVAQAREALAGYLHNPTVAQPVEPFHGLLLAFLQDTPAGLWSLLERDPEEVVILDEQGAPVPGQGPVSVPAWRADLLAAGAECTECPWFESCAGYFKWPRTDYDCAGVKALIADIAAAAGELRAALAAHAAGQG